MPVIPLSRLLVRNVQLYGVQTQRKDNLVIDGILFIIWILLFAISLEPDQ